jgi:DNA-binding NarL/FixJ family response regulator
MFIIYSDKDSLQFPHKGTYSEASKDELMGDSLIRAKLKSVIKLEQQQQSKNALQVLGYLNGAEGVKKKELVGTLVPIAMQGIVSRTQAENFVDAPSKVSPEMLKVVTDKMDQKEEDPRTDEERAADEMDTSQFSADELEQALAMAAGGQQMSQAPVAPNMMAPGTNPADAGIIANQQAGY